MKAPERRSKRDRDGRSWISPDREWLEREYVALGKSARQVSDEVGTHHHVVSRWLDDVGIVRRTAGESYRVTPRVLRDSDSYLHQKAREIMIIAKVPWQCVGCGSTDELNVHHRDGILENNDLENLEYRCHSCHRRVHPDKGRKRRGIWETSRSGGLAVGIDPGRKSSGFVIFMLYPALSVAKAKRLPNHKVCDLLWWLDIHYVYMENYRLYPWALGSLRWNELKEVRLIGAVEEICRRREIHLIEVSPSQSKALVKDQDLIQLGTWSRNVHVNDAFRVFWAGLLGNLGGE